MSKYIDGKELDDFQMDVTFKGDYTIECVSALMSSLISPDNTTSLLGDDTMNAMVDILNHTKDIMKRYGVHVCAPHYTVEDGNYLPCYNMDSRCPYCTKKSK